MTIEPVNKEPFYALFAPDGSFQCMSMAPDFPSCVAAIKMLHKAGLSKSFHQLIKIDGYKILPVLVTLEQCGDEDTAFKHGKN